MMEKRKHLYIGSEDFFLSRLIKDRKLESTTGHSRLKHARDKNTGKVLLEESQILAGFRGKWVERCI